jgi:hypothetical protein
MQKQISFSLFFVALSYSEFMCDSSAVKMCNAEKRTKTPMLLMTLIKNKEIYFSDLMVLFQYA